MRKNAYSDSEDTQHNAHLAIDAPNVGDGLPRRCSPPAKWPSSSAATKRPSAARTCAASSSANGSA